jgi:hypothetical protein
VRGKSFYYGWADVIQPYQKKHDFIQCHSDEILSGKGGGPANLTYADYFFN